MLFGARSGVLLKLVRAARRSEDQEMVFIVHTARYLRTVCLHIAKHLPNQQIVCKLALQSESSRIWARPETNVPDDSDFDNVQVPLTSH